MSGLARVVRAGVRRRTAQTLVTGLAAFAGVTASVLGGSLLVAANGPFDQAFARQDGAHLVAAFDVSRTDAARLSASAHASGVTAAAGPFRTVALTPHDASAMGLSPMTVAARAQADQAVDRVALRQGHWASGPGQIVLAESYQADPQLDRIGAVVDFPALRGDPKLTVVGIAQSVTQSADAWVAPSGIAALEGPGSSAGYQMLYRFASAGTAAAIAADRASVAAATPHGSLQGVQSWLDTKRGTDRNTELFVPFLVAFGLLGVVMSVLMVGNVVAGAVGSASRRIGVLKALGGTPAQVVRAYMAQALIPAGAGTLLGVAAGNALALPVLATAGQVYGSSDAGVAPWVDVAVAACALALVTAASWAAALRAGRLRTVEALSVGRTPAAGRGRRAAGLAARLPLPRPVSLGLAHPFARPVRTAAMLAAVVFGATAATFAVGMSGTISWVQAAKDHGRADVTVGPADLRPGVPFHLRGSAAAVAAAINAQAGTARYWSVGETDVSVAGVSGPTSVFTLGGDSSRAGYRMVSGRWFRGAGEAVAPSTFLAATATRVGGTVVLLDSGRQVPVRIVGEVFDPHAQTDEVLTGAATLPGAQPFSWSVQLRPGTRKAGYIASLDRALGPLGLRAGDGGAGGRSDVITVLASLTALLTLLLVAVAALGVLNSVVLQTRDRVRDLGVAKALGMAPGQTTAMVLSSVALVGLAGGAIGVPLGLLLHAVVVPAMGRSAGLTFPAAAIHIFSVPDLVALGLGGVVIAALGALLPAVWAARTPTATALRTE